MLHKVNLKSFTKSIIQGVNLKFLLFFLLCNILCSYEEEIEKRVSELLPPEVKLNFVTESPLENFYALNVSSNNILYVSKDFKFVFTGELIDLSGSYPININEQYSKRLINNLLSDINEEDVIEFQSKGEKHKLKVFTDVECAYCRMFHSEISNLMNNGVTIQYLAFPRDGVLGKSYKKMVSAWCSKDRQATITKLKNSETVDTLTCQNPVEDQFILGRTLGVTGTPTIFLEDGLKIGGYIPAKELIKILNNG